MITGAGVGLRSKSKMTIFSFQHIFIYSIPDNIKSMSQSHLTFWRAGPGAEVGGGGIKIFPELVNSKKVSTNA